MRAPFVHLDVRVQRVAAWFELRLLTFLPICLESVPFPARRASCPDATAFVISIIYLQYVFIYFFAADTLEAIFGSRVVYSAFCNHLHNCDDHHFSQEDPL